MCPIAQLRGLPLSAFDGSHEPCSLAATGIMAFRGRRLLYAPVGSRRDFGGSFEENRIGLSISVLCPHVKQQ